MVPSDFTPECNEMYITIQPPEEKPSKKKNDNKKDGKKNNNALNVSKISYKEII